MDEQGKNQFSNQEKVQVLIQEYITLRQEIIQRTNQGFQIFSVGGIFFGLLVNRGSFGLGFWIILVISFCALLSAGLVTRNEVRRAAKRVRMVERRINKLANSKLLTWETIRGGAVRGSQLFWGKR